MRADRWRPAVLAALLSCCGGEDLTPGHDDSLGQRSEALDRDLDVGSSGEDVAAAQAFLSVYGYFPNPALRERVPSWTPLVALSPAGIGMFDLATQEAVRALQERAGLTVSGRIDADTHKLLRLRRCAVPEHASEDDLGGRFSVQGSTWSKSTLTWSVAELTPDLPRNAVEAEVSAAFAVWGTETFLSFVQTAQTADIQISFAPLDGPGGSFVRAAFPAEGGDIWLDADESWSLTTPSGPDAIVLRTALIHAIGHALGLAHSSRRGTAMYPYLDGSQPEGTLQSADRTAISALYDRAREVLVLRAHDVALAPNGEAWCAYDNGPAVGQDVVASVWKGERWEAAANSPAVLRIAVAPDGAVWTSNVQGNIWMRPADDNRWRAIAGCANDLSVGADGSVWGVGCPAAARGGFKVYRWSGGDQWEEASGDLGAAKIAVAPDGTPWIVTTDGSIYRRTSASALTGSWQLLPGVANDIGIGPDGSVWAVGVIENHWGKKIYLWDDAAGDSVENVRGDWLTTPGSGASIAVGPRDVWFTNKVNSLAQQIPSAGG